MNYRAWSPKKKLITVSVMMVALTGTAWATAFWVGQLKMGQPPGYSPAPTQVNVPSGVSTGHGCTPINDGGGCWATYNGNLASSGDIRALSTQVYDLQKQMAKDISWLGYYTARAVRNNGAARTLANVQNASQVPGNMPCGADSCTAESDAATDIAGGTGAFGDQNPISGVPMVGKQVKQGLLAKRSLTFLTSSYAVHNQYFCSPSEKAAGMCTGSSVDPNLDIEGSTLLDTGSMQTAEKNPQLHSEGRVAFIQNITNQIPVPALRKNAYESPAGQLAVGAKLQYQAEQSLAQTALDQIAALHEPVNNLGTTLNSTIKGLGMPKVPANISVLQYLSYMYRAQYGNPKFYINLASQTSAVSLLREVVLMQSQELQYQYLAMRMRMAMDAMAASEYATNAQANYAHVAKHFNDNTGYATTAG